MSPGRARDHELLDALESMEGVAIEQSVWRALRAGRDALSGRPSGGRWDPGTFDVIYFSLDPLGARAELYFHLSRQPVFPSRAEFVLHEVAVETRRTLRFADLTELAPLGVNPEEYPGILYPRTQEIGDAAAFLGFDGFIAPSARWDCLNLVVFTGNLASDALELVSSVPIDWSEHRR